MKLPKPKQTKKSFYSSHMENRDLEEMLDFGITYSLGMRIQGIAGKKTDYFLNKAIVLMRREGYPQGKIDYIIRRKMNKVKLGVENFRICRRYRA